VIATGKGHFRAFADFREELGVVGREFQEVRLR
jgi:hypothetical protein